MVAIPVNEWKISVICMNPLFLIGIYFQAKGDALVLEEYKKYLPPEIVLTMRTQNEMIF